MGNIYLNQPNKEKHSLDDAFANMRFGASGMQGWRTNMEDAHISKFNIVKNVHVFGVFDGHGGREVAKFVEKHFIEQLVINPNFKTGTYDKALYDTFLKMDQMLVTPDGKKEVNLYKNEDSKSDFATDSFAGCTACVVILADNEIVCANAGDSRAVLSTKGQVFELSHDHKPDNEIERTRIEKAGGYISDGRINGNLNLSRALGDLEYKKDDKIGVHEQLITACPEIVKKPITADDEFIVLGCDGIWEIKSNQEIIDFVAPKLSKDSKVSGVVEDLLDAIVAPDTINGLGCDNMTCIVITLKDKK